MRWKKKSVGFSFLSITHSRTLSVSRMEVVDDGQLVIDHRRGLLAAVDDLTQRCEAHLLVREDRPVLVAAQQRLHVIGVDEPLAVPPHLRQQRGVLAGVLEPATLPGAEEEIGVDRFEPVEELCQLRVVALPSGRDDVQNFLLDAHGRGLPRLGDERCVPGVRGASRSVRQG